MMVTQAVVVVGWVFNDVSSGLYDRMVVMFIYPMLIHVTSLIVLLFDYGG